MTSSLMSVPPRTTNDDETTWVCLLAFAVFLDNVAPHYATVMFVHVYNINGMLLGWWWRFVVSFSNYAWIYNITTDTHTHTHIVFVVHDIVYWCTSRIETTRKLYIIQAGIRLYAGRALPRVQGGEGERDLKRTEWDETWAIEFHVANDWGHVIIIVCKKSYTRYRYIMYATPLQLWVRFKKLSRVSNYYCLTRRRHVCT